MTTAIIVAVEEEFRAIRKKMPRADLESAGGFSFVRGELGGKKVALAKSGMGTKRAYDTTCVLIQAVEPQDVLIAGFGAGLREGVAPGDLVVATEVRDYRWRSTAGGGQDWPVALIQGVPEIV